MVALVIISALIVLSLAINAFFKYKSYNKKDKSIWQDGDSVRIKGTEGEANNSGFMTRLS